MVASLNPDKILPAELRCQVGLSSVGRLEDATNQPAARINKDSMHIKIVITQSKYKRIIMRSDDPGRVYRRKGYGAINRLNCCVALWGTDGVYLGFD